MFTTFGYETRKARKQHVCDCCAAPILPGESHEVWTCVVDGHPDRLRAHAFCATVLPYICDDGEFSPADWPEFRNDAARQWVPGCDPLPWTRQKGGEHVG